MTPRERAEKVYRRWSFSSAGEDEDDIVALTDAIEEAVAQEREACAKTVENLHDDSIPFGPELETLQSAAAAIRARGQS